MPCSAASDLGLHCLPMSLLWDARLKWVNGHIFFLTTDFWPKILVTADFCDVEFFWVQNSFIDY